MQSISIPSPLQSAADAVVPPRSSHLPARLGRLGWLTLCLTATACAGISGNDRAAMTTQIAQGDFRAASAAATQIAISDPKGTAEDLPYALEAAAVYLHTGTPRQTTQVLDGAETLMKDAEAARFNTGYRFNSYDGTMVNTYKALAFLATGDRASARVELNRADDRQRRATELFESEIASQRQKLEERGQGGADMGAALRTATADASVQQQLAELGRYSGYEPFVNPFATFMHGIFFTYAGETSSDREKGLQSLRRVRDMAGPGAGLEEEISAAGRGSRPAPRVWVVLENGGSATFRQNNITFPVPVKTRSGTIASAVTVALPQFVPGQQAARMIYASGAGGPVATRRMADFDAVMASEFRRRYPTIIGTAVVEAVLKTAMQQVAGQTGNGALMLLAAVASNISTTDTRSWTALPHEFQFAGMVPPSSGKLTLQGEGGAPIGSVDVPVDAPSIVYIKMQRAGARPEVQVIRL
jgi:hypothetical protein